MDFVDDDVLRGVETIQNMTMLNTIGCPRLILY